MGVSCHTCGCCDHRSIVDFINRGQSRAVKLFGSGAVSSNGDIVR